MAYYEVTVPNYGPVVVHVPNKLKHDTRVFDIITETVARTANLLVEKTVGDFVGQLESDVHILMRAVRHKHVLYVQGGTTAYVQMQCRYCPSGYAVPRSWIDLRLVRPSDTST